MTILAPRDLARASRIAVPLDGVKLRESGVGDGSFTIGGHSAVFNRLSMDLGGFQEKIDPGAFTSALARNPDVLAVWDHDTRYVLARTMNKTLTLSEDEFGLRTWMRVAPTSYSADLRVLMERGDIDQASFMFTIAKERLEWAGGDDDPLIFTIEEIGELYDVTVTGRGAYPQTDMTVSHARSHRVTTALQEGRAGGLTLDDARERGFIVEDPEAKPDEPAVEEGATAQPDPVEDAARTHALQVEHAKRRRAEAHTPR